MSDAYVVTIVLTNDDVGDLAVWVEPWGERVVLKCGYAVELGFDSKTQGAVDITHVAKGVVVHGFRGSSARISKSGKVIWNAHESLPE
jgi:hypothetical protein